MTTRGKLVFTLLFLAFVGFGVVRWWGKLKPSSGPLSKIEQLNAHARARGQSLAQMALAWVLRDRVVTSALIGASKVSQLEDNLGALHAASFSAEELAHLDRILAG